jgi:hypothetical protein
MKLVLDKNKTPMKMMQTNTPRITGEDVGIFSGYLQSKVVG